MQGEREEALRLAREASEAASAAEYLEMGETTIQLALAEALAANGCQDAARDVIRAAAGRLRTVADRIQDAHLRRCYLEGVHENVQTLALERAWLDDAS
jgi:hypothetical protein